MIKRLLKIIGVLILLLIVILVGAYYAIQQESVQNWLTQKVTKQLSKKLKTEVSVKHIKIDFLNHLNLEGVYIAGQLQDTLLYAGQLQFKITDWFFLKNEKPTIHYIGLHDAQVNLSRSATDSIWNYNFITEALAPAKKDTTGALPSTAKSSDTTMAFDLKSVDLQNVQFNSIDKWVGTDLQAKVGSLQLDANQIDWKKKWIDLTKLNIEKVNFLYADYIGGRPPRKKKDSIDNSPFNPYNWLVTLRQVKVSDTRFQYIVNHSNPTPKVFSEKNINLTNVNITANDLQIVGDTITGKLKNISAKEQCGLEIKKLTANLTLHPRRTTLQNLYLQTNNSTLQNSYEMVYNRFPDFNDYINKVIMKCNFFNSNISFSDIAYFAPQVNALPVKNVIIKSGSAMGTVANLQAKNVDIRVGNSLLVGNLSMKGLPDINTTFIELESKNLQTSGAELIKFVPAANTKAVAWYDLKSINFKGKYKGYISDFYTDGTITTNLGSVTTNIHLTFPKNSQPTYQGFFASKNLQLGKIIKQNTIGLLVASGDINGKGFDFATLQTSFKGTIQQIQTANYTYQNIFINGTVANKKFSGKIDSNDPNLAMNFDGDLDFSSSNPDFKLRTKLVKFDLQKLGLSNQPISGSAYMDLNFRGNSIDNFTGKAKLYNVSLNNSKKTIYLDSAILTSTPIGNNKNITLKSSAADASLTGNFTIANLPAAMQLYLSNYLPNYISKPKNVALQQFNFNILTKNLEPILQTFIPNIFGCNDATLVGNLNMFNQQLALQVNAPFFGFKNVSINNIIANTNGDLQNLNIEGTTSLVKIGDQEIVPSATFSTKLGNDTAVLLVNTAGGAYNVKDATLQAKGFAKTMYFL